MKKGTYSSALLTSDQSEIGWRGGAFRFLEAVKKGRATTYNWMARIRKNGVFSG
jgi:hypothetical protein